MLALRQSNMAMENTLFKADFPIETPIPSGFSIAMFDHPGVTYSRTWNICQDRHLKSPSFVGKYTSTMEPMGLG